MKLSGDPASSVSGRGRFARPTDRRVVRRPDVEYAEPNFVVTFEEPNDPLFPQLWGLKIGQSVNGGPPGPGADTRARGLGHRLEQVNVVAVVDTGID